MLSLEIIRREPEEVRRALEGRGDALPLNRLLELDAERRKVLVEGDNLRARRNEVSKQVGRLLSEAGKNRPMIYFYQGRQAEQAKEEMRRVGDRITALEERAKSIEGELQELLLNLPNIPSEDVPIGQGEEHNRVIRTWGEPATTSFVPLPHWDLGESLDIIDFRRGARLSGSRFFVLKGAGARLQRALINWFLDLHVKEHGYSEVYLPYMVQRDVMVGSGNLPKFADNLYHDEEDDLWLIPTAEVPLTNLHRDEILDPGSLPIYYVAHTPCFRREKAAAGRDTRGIKRVHQFDKVELYKFVEPETSDEELEKLVGDAEAVCRGLGIPYRVLELCTGELGFPSAKSYDLEMWAPGSQEWLEVSSCSNCTDFQARRANIRYRPEAGARPQHVHTLNGSGLALPRVIIAILENFQQPDGSVVVPEVLRPYAGLEVIEKGQAP